MGVGRGREERTGEGETRKLQSVVSAKMASGPNPSSPDCCYFLFNTPPPLRMPPLQRPASVPRPCLPGNWCCSNEIRRREGQEGWGLRPSTVRFESCQATRPKTHKKVFIQSK
eukprot:3939790-Rhodomonas_salina.2